VQPCESMHPLNLSVSFCRLHNNTNSWPCQSQVGIAWTLITTVLFVFPPELPVTGENMNYCVVAFGVMVLIAAFQWIFDGRKNYTGPQIDVDMLVPGPVEGSAVDMVEESGSGSEARKGEGEK
jgi:hypothetical protein